MTSAPAAQPQRTRIRAAAEGSGLVAFGTLLFFTLFAGDFWRNLISWPGYLVLVFGLAVASGVLVWRLRPAFNWRRTPRMLALFVVLIVLSIAWSAYPGASALGVLSTIATGTGALFLALCLDWPQLLRALSHAFRWILGLSFAFELIVSLFVRRPIIPLFPMFTMPADGKIPQAFYWSRDLLFHGGQIQGILGNSNLLAMVALLALAVFGVQLADRSVRRGAGIAWLVIAVLALALTRSSTVILAGVFMVAVLGFALWARRARPDRRLPLYLTGAGLVVVVGVLVTVFASRIPAIFGKSEDLTGRLDIWHKVIELAQQRPAFGWGWVSYWAPWVYPFDGLAVRNKVQYLQAHNAWLDVWLQVGIVGLVVFILLVLTTFRRTWFFAVDRPRHGVSDVAPFTALTLFPLLVLAAFIAQSFAESRLLIEAGFTLLAVFSVKTKQASP
ncbi:O-antigen ligase family protein [Leifsonia sp. NPDC058292]|uniref:O-antigen ligase family protein n=1 Tax=Leifsonia sp. NPDC058292 TaxID=3346428 RepID=UPI0036D7A787